jgi:hypothetical protein
VIARRGVLLPYGQVERTGCSLDIQLGELRSRTEKSNCVLIRRVAEGAQDEYRSIVKIGPSNSPDDRDDGPTVGASCRCLNLSTSIGGTRSKVEGGDRHDLEPEVCMRTQDTRFIQVRVAGVATLRPVWSSISRPALGCRSRRDCRCSARYPSPPLYSPGGGFLVGYKAGVLIGLHGMSPRRITGEF